MKRCVEVSLRRSLFSLQTWADLWEPQLNLTFVRIQRVESRVAVQPGRGRGRGQRAGEQVGPRGLTRAPPRRLRHRAPPITTCRAQPNQYTYTQSRASLLGSHTTLMPGKLPSAKDEETWQTGADNTTSKTRKRTQHEVITAKQYHLPFKKEPDQEMRKKSKREREKRLCNGS